MDVVARGMMVEDGSHTPDYVARMIDAASLAAPFMCSFMCASLGTACALAGVTVCDALHSVKSFKGIGGLLAGAAAFLYFSISLFFSLLLL